MEPHLIATGATATGAKRVPRNCFGDGLSASRHVADRGFLTEGELADHLEESCAIRCPQSDSNRHWTDFKSAASANWAMGARRPM